MSRLKEILNKYSTELPEINFSELNALESNLQEASSRDVAFYNIVEGREEAFLKRLKESKHGLLIVNRKIEGVDSKTCCIPLESFLDCQKELADELYGEEIPKVIGITGTNGKTSTAWFVSNLLKEEGLKSLLVGTLGIYKVPGGIEKDLSMTTPSYIQFRNLARDYKDDVDFFVLEVSSHALHQKRLYGIELEVAGWTSFSQDHLDYHKTMEEYFKAKELISDLLKDDGKLFVSPKEEELNSKIKSPKKTKAMSFESFTPEKTSLFWECSFNKKNLEVAYSMAKEIVGDLKSFDLEKIPNPPGRFQIVNKGDIDFIVDYAHTPDALEKLLESVKKSFSDKKLITVFGCGGDRDRIKRPLMSQAAAQYSDHLILTSDNPRTEDPLQIIGDMKEGLKVEFDEEVDRKKAIELSYKISKPGDIIIIAGKGHETYQEINGVKHPFNDVEIIKEL